MSGYNRFWVVTWCLPPIALDLAHTDAHAVPPVRTEVGECSDVRFKLRPVTEFCTAGQVTPSMVVSWAGRLICDEEVTWAARTRLQTQSPDFLLRTDFENVCRVSTRGWKCAVILWKNRRVALKIDDVGIFPFLLFH